jgi:MarR family transcriptional regulator, organic hydroperoxide resistance regulator
VEEIDRVISIIKMIKQVMDTMRQSMQHNFKGDQFKEMNITGPQGMMLGMLNHYGEMKVSDLSEKLGLSNSTASGIIDRLEKQGLVERTRTSEDRRVVLVSVTPEYKRNIQEHFREIKTSFELMMSSATDEELDTILEGLSTLKKIIDRQKE